MTEGQAFSGEESSVFMPVELPLPWWRRLLVWLKAIVRFAIAVFVAFAAVCFSYLGMKFVWRLTEWINETYLLEPF